MGVISGEDIEIDVPKNYIGKLTVDSGKSEQATRDGKNMINVYDTRQVTGGYTVDSDDWISITIDRTSESTSGYSNYFINPNLDLKPNTNYYFVLEIKNVSSQLGTSSFSVVSTTTTSWEGQFASAWGLSFNDLNNGDIKIQRINTRNDFSDCVTFSRMFIGVVAGDKVSITFRLSVLEEQPTVETFEYEAYGVSPSPDYPSEIRNVGSDVNLFELDNTKYPIDTDSTILHTFANETVTLNGSLTSKKDTYLIGKNSTTNYICTLKPNTTYTILIEIVSGSFTGANQWILRAAGAKNYQVGSLLQPDYYDNKSIKTFTTGDTEINIMSVLLYNNDASVSYTNLKFRIKLVEGSEISSYTFYNQGSVNVNVETKNKFSGWIKQCFINSSNGIRSYSATGMTSKLCEIKPNIAYRMSGIAVGSYGKNKFIAYYRADKTYISRTGSSNVSSITNRTPADAKYCALGIAGSFADTTEMDNFIADSANIQLEEGTTITSHQEYGKTEIQFPFVEGQVLHEGDYLADDGIHQTRKTVVFDGSSDETWDIRNDTHEMRINLGTDAIYNSQILANQLKQVSAYITTGDNIRWVSNSTIICISSSTLDTANMTLEQWKEYLQSNNLILEYGIKEIVIPYAAAQQEAYDEMQNLILYEGYNLITTIDEIKPDLLLDYKKIAEDYDCYISSDGYFVIPEYDAKYQIDFYESSIPSMPESSEVAVKIAGKDGTLPLKSTYEPIPFNIVCYTEDNLTPSEKIVEERKVNYFLNSIKNNTKKLSFENEEKFYEVKYNGALTTTRYPKHIKFSIPLKSSDPYAKNFIKTVVKGSSTPQIINSDTIKEVGVKITILGPATTPELAINDYEMVYSQNIVDGAKVIIDTANSTITNITSSNIKTNVMPYYNHQFPKINPGENEIKVQSGISNPSSQVITEWYDLKL